jgi:hypothetical protein
MPGSQAHVTSSRHQIALLFPAGPGRWCHLAGFHKGLEVALAGKLKIVD